MTYEMICRWHSYAHDATTKYKWCRNQMCIMQHNDAEQMMQQRDAYANTTKKTKDKHELNWTDTFSSIYFSYFSSPMSLSK